MHPFAQNPLSNPAILGCWEVVGYSEQGVQVDKKGNAAAQAQEVYRYVQKQRRNWYGFDPDASDEYSKRRRREYERWAERDSTKEVARIAEAIATPYFAVFFPDGTLSLYNRDIQTGQVSYTESRQYVFSPATMSIDIYTPGYLPPAQPGSWIDRWEAQILLLTADQMKLFLPDGAEVVELVKVPFRAP